MINITRFRLVYYIFSGALVLGSIIVLGIFGLKFGIDFTGGSLIEGRYEGGTPSKEQIFEAMGKAGIHNLSFQGTESGTFIVRFGDSNPDIYAKTKDELTKLGQNLSPSATFQELSFESIGPSVGDELKTNTLYAIILVLVMIAGYVAYAFRKVSYPVSSGVYGIVTLITLFHDIIIPLGLFALLGHYSGIEVNVPFVAAILTVMGYSVHDTIIVFDRVRENLVKMHSASFEDIVDASLRQTFVRSLNTSLTVLLVLLAIYLMGGEGVRYFALTLLVGIGAGTYSSIFVASPLLFSWYQWTERSRTKKYRR